MRTTSLFRANAITLRRGEMSSSTIKFGSAFARRIASSVSGFSLFGRKRASCTLASFASPGGGGGARCGGILSINFAIAASSRP